MKTIPVGTVTERLVNVKSCGACDCVIDEVGMCSFGCIHDFLQANKRDPASMTTRVWNRVDTLVSEVPGTALTNHVGPTR